FTQGADRDAAFGFGQGSDRTDQDSERVGLALAGEPYLDHGALHVERLVLHRQGATIDLEPNPLWIVPGEQARETRIEERGVVAAEQVLDEATVEERGQRVRELQAN